MLLLAAGIAAADNVYSQEDVGTTMGWGENVAPRIDGITPGWIPPGETGVIGVRAHDSDGMIISVTFDMSAFDMGIVPPNQVSGNNFNLEFTMPEDASAGTRLVEVNITDDDDAVTTTYIPVTVWLARM